MMSRKKAKIAKSHSVLELYLLSQAYGLRKNHQNVAIILRNQLVIYVFCIFNFDY
jgi:hypothetical protein